MIDISAWMEVFLKHLGETFGQRIWFVGLQGSYGRGEAADTSDIDVVVIFNELFPQDLGIYRQMLERLPNRELVCGFVSGKAELLNWEPADLFQFYYDTIPFYGSLDGLLPLLDHDAVARAIRIGAGNIYHGCVHNMIHERDADMLRGLFKGASFVLQAVAFQQTGRYFKRQRNLMDVLRPEDRLICEMAAALKSGAEVDFDRMSQTLFVWAKVLLTGE